MKNPSEKLNKYFNNKCFFRLIPFVNKMITFYKTKKYTNMHYDKNNNIWSIKEKDCGLIFINSCSPLGNAV
jgi:hypothetical protein